MVALALVYAALVVLGLRWAVAVGVASPVWPAAGLAMAALVLGGIRLWPGIFLGYLFGSLVQPLAYPEWMQAVLAAGNTAAAVAAVRLLRRRRFDLSFDAFRDFALFAAAAALAAGLAATAGTIMVGVVITRDPAELQLAWLHWFLGDFTGLLIIATAVLSWAAGRLPRTWRWWLQFIACLVLTGAIGWLVFLRRDEHLYAFLLFAPLIWSALALHLRGASATCLLVAVMGVWGTTLGIGPFAGALAQDRFIDLQLFILTMAAATLLLAVVADERRANRALALSEARLRLALDATGTGLWKLDLRTGMMNFSPECARITGLAARDIDATRSGVMRIVHPDDQQALRSAFWQAVEARTLFESVFRLVLRDGAVRWLEARGRVLFDHDDRPEAVLGTLSDITARTRDARRLEEQARLLDLATDPILIRDMDGRITYWNQGATGLYGYTAEEAQGCLVSDLLQTEFPEPLDQLHASLLASDRWEGELLHTCKDGRHVIVHARWVLNRDAKGRPLSVMQTYTDITERRRTEANTRFLGELDRHIAQTTGADDVADVGLRMLGLHFGLMRCTLTDIDLDHGRIHTLHEWTHGDAPRVTGTYEVRHFFATELGKRLAAGEVVAVEDLRTDPLTIAYRGNYERFGTVALAAASYVIEGRLAGTLTVASGEPRRWRLDELHLLREVVARLWPAIERARSIGALRESEARFRQMADTAPMMIFVTEADGTCTYLSRRWSEFTGRMPEAELGFGWADVVHTDDREAVGEMFNEAIMLREPFSMEYRALRWDGVYRWILATGRPRFGTGSEFLGFIGAMLDITERREAEEALRDADRRKDEFLATLAHELRNPLSPIRTGLQVLNLTDNPDTARRTRQMMDRQLGHMVRLIDDLLDVSRITSGKVVLQRDRISLQDAARAAVETARPLIESARHRLSLAMPEETLWVDADPTRLAQVMGNLLTNAAKYTPDGGEIELRVHPCDGEACVSVRDTGLGIPPDALEDVFGMFAQVNRTLDRSQGGLGIGLALSRRLVEMHGGRIEAWSEGLGRGSTFTVRLPLAVANSATADAAEEDASALARPCRVLVVDDNADAADSLAMMLQLEGHQTRVAYSGTEGLLVACEFRPAVAFLDIGMPGMTGYELAIRLRREATLEGLVLIAVSGWGGDADKRQATQSGFNAHLTKPVSAADVHRLVAGACRRDEVREASAGEGEAARPEDGRDVRQGPGGAPSTPA